jgi:hypothetical protein
MRLLYLASGGDKEADHAEADALLIECLRSQGYGEGCDLFDMIEKWYA